MISFYYVLLLLVSFKIQAEPVGLSCYYDTGVKEINGAATDEEGIIILYALFFNLM